MKAEITVTTKTYWTIFTIGCVLIIGAITYALMAGNVEHLNYLGF